MPEQFAEVALLLVNDEEFRTEPFAHGPRFADFDACLCFEGGERTRRREEAVVVRRKAAAAIRVEATASPRTPALSPTPAAAPCSRSRRSRPPMAATARPAPAPRR